MTAVKNLLRKLFAPGESTKVCRTRMISDRFFECKVKKPNPAYCDHSLSSGGSFICNHDNRAVFARK